ncbi:MAG: glycine cleavage system protein GcvH [Actinomycetota bacterium]
MNIPEELRYSDDHEWVRVEGGEAVVGISAFAVEQLGDIVFVELPDPGAIFGAGDAFGVIESAKAASDLLLPVGGAVIASNPALNDSPELVNDDPYGEGWLVRITLADAAQVDTLVDTLKDAAAYRAMIAEE